MKKNNKAIKKEMEKIYDNHYALRSVCKRLKKGYLNAFGDNPKFALLIKLGIVANIGIWTLFLLEIYKTFFFGY